MPEIEARHVAVLAIVNSPLDRARLYFRHRPTPVALAADADNRTRIAFGVPARPWQLYGMPREEVEPQMIGPNALRFDLGGELQPPLPFLEARAELNRRDGYTLTTAEEQRRAAGAGIEAFYLADRDGVIRWRWIEGFSGLRDLFSFPNAGELLGAAEEVARAR